MRSLSIASQLRNCERGQARLARLQFTIAQVIYSNPAEIFDLAIYAQVPIFAPTSKKPQIIYINAYIPN